MLNPMRSRRSVRLLAASLAGVAALALAGCGSDSDAAGDDAANPNLVPGNSKAPLYDELPAEYQDKKITIALDPGFGVLNSVKDGSKEFDGLNADLAKAIGAELGAEVELVPAAFAQILVGVNSGRYDMSMSAVTDTLERQAEVDFVDYLVVTQSLFVPEGNPKGVTGDILTACGLKLSVVQGTTDEELFDKIGDACAEAGKPEPTQVNLDSVDAAYLAIESGRIDAMIRENSSNRTDTTAERVDLPYGSSYYFGAIFAKDNAELRDAWLAGTEGIIASGEYGSILEENNQTAIALDKPGINLQK